VVISGSQPTARLRAGPLRLSVEVDGADLAYFERCDDDADDGQAGDQAVCGYVPSWRQLLQPAAVVSTGPAVVGGGLGTTWSPRVPAWWRVLRVTRGERPLIG